MKGILLKEGKLRHRLAEALGPGTGGRALEILAWAGAGLLLAGLPLLGAPAPLGACLVLCAGLWGPGLGALAGAWGGYLLFWGWGPALEPLTLSLSCFAGALIFRNTPVSRSLLTGSLSALVGGLFLLEEGFGLLPLLRLPLGVGLAALLPWARDRGAALLGKKRLEAGTRQAPPPPEPLPPQRAVVKALETMHRVLAREEPLLQPLQLAEVYDFAAERVCRCCVGYGRCWEQNAEDTYRDLCAAGEQILHRGVALREDLPERFAERCGHTAGFLTAVNQALDRGLTRRREAHRREECRRVAVGQYLALARLLEALSRPRPTEPPAFAPELAVGSAGRAGNRVSGDRGASFRDPFGHFYLLLCDGMGTGAPARAESDRSTRLLKAFLEAGLEPDTALDLVNGFYLLRRTTVFATLDLLRLDLHTGLGTLYKWGAAPSYLRREGQVEKIGTATPPPGTDAAEGRCPGQYELSLREGETLVMVSDGAFGEETARRLAEISQGSVRDLASCLITLGQQDAADDRTAVVIRLKELQGAARNPQNGPARKGA